MRPIEIITGKEVVDRYQILTGDVIKTEKDQKHFEKIFEEWVRKVQKSLERRSPADISLSKANYLGKKTRALLSVMEIKEPKTLGQLIVILWKLIPEKT